MVEAVVTRPRPEAGDGQHCPACSKGIDPLRAGQVAIIDGRFLYFCNEQCKRVLLEGAGPVAAEAETLEPPAVSADISVVSAEREVMPPCSLDALQVSPESARGAIRDDRGETSKRSDPPPQTLRSPASEGASSGRRPIPSDPMFAPAALPVGATLATKRRIDRAQVIRWISVAGAVAGALAPSVALAGAWGATVRLPLAAVAAGAVLARQAVARRDPADTHPLGTVGPALGALVAAAWAALTLDPHALSLASFAGLTAFAVLVVELLLDRARDPVAQARAHIACRLDMNVRVVRDDQSTLVPACEVKPGEQVVIEEGELVGVDSLITAGDALVSPWLDSPIEMKKSDGDPLLAGAQVVSGRLRVTTTWAGQERAWARLALSPGFRADVAAPLARGARVAAGRGAPIAALLAAIAAYSADAKGPEILAAACAAAVALGARGVAAAVALHYSRGQLSALSHGIVYKDAAAFDSAGRADIAVLCSRGTVLMGEPEIVALEGLGPLGVERVLGLAAGAEAQSTHPFASAILRAARTRGERPENVRSVTVHAGLGVTALSANGERLAVGSRALLLHEKVSVALADARVAELEAQGRSVLLVALGGKLIGLLALQDGLRPGARAAVQRLLDARLEPVLLSGEARDTCETMGRALDIEHIRPEVLPADRGAEVCALGEGGHIVAVLGLPSTHDGALSAGDVSVALGAAGSTPGEWSVALASDDVRDAARALSIAHETRDRAKIALVVGLSPAIVAVLAIAFGVAPLAVAPLAALAGAVAALVHAKG
jgi:Cu+-exporting ATPase